MVALNEPAVLDREIVDQFRQDGFVILKQIMSADVVAAHAADISQIFDERNRLKSIPMQDRTLYDRAFIQVGNLWQQSPRVRDFAFSKRLASAAAQLLGVPGVRMWHDQALYKEPSGGFTPWHVDQQYWPMASSQCVTAWIPLQPVPMEMGPLSFARGSHRLRIGHDLAISNESERVIGKEIRQKKIDEVQQPYELGDVSFHLVWTLHRAGGNETTMPRRVFTVIYMDSKMRLAEPKNENQVADWKAWTPSTNIGDVMADPLNPLLFEMSSADSMQLETVNSHSNSPTAS